MTDSQRPPTPGLPNEFSIELMRILNSAFTLDEIRTLCFELDVDFENLSGDTKAAKARELILWGKRSNALQLIQDTIKSGRPDVVFHIEYDSNRAHALQESIMASASQPVQDAFKEFTEQIAAYVDEFNLLHEKMQEWKEVHNYLQDLQNHFAPCRGYIYTFSKLDLGDDDSQEKDRFLYSIEVEWRPCKRVLRRLEQFATQILVIGDVYVPDKPTEGPQWLLAPKRAAKIIDKALFDRDLLALREGLSEFGDETDQHLYLADKALLKTANEIMSLRRPNVSKEPI